MTGNSFKFKALLATALCVFASACGSDLQPNKVPLGDLLKAQSGIIGYWNFNETTPGTIPGGYDYADLSGNNHPAKILGTVQMGTTGYTGLGLTASGAGSVIIPIDLSSNKVVTLSVFVYPHISSFNQHNILWEYTPDSSTNNGFMASLDDNSASPIHSFLNWMHGVTGTYARSSSSLSSAWHHVVVVYDQSVASQNTITLYVDGNTVSTSTYQSMNTNNSGTFSNSYLFLLCRAGNQFCLNADLDELTIWNRAVTLSELHTLYPF